MGGASTGPDHFNQKMELFASTTVPIMGMLTLTPFDLPLVFWKL